MVLRVNAARHSVLVSHRDIKGYMPAMTMEFPAARKQVLDGLAPGARIRFTLAVSRSRSQISHIADLRSPVEFKALELPKPAAGTVVPDFELTDQTGQSVRLSNFLGRVVALDFIYTRCPLPDVCPRLSANFARLQRRFGGRLVLLSVTIDPQFDTPEVLARYATLWKADPANWKFLTGDGERIRKLASFLGMVYFPEDGSMTHTSETAVIGRAGRLAGIVEGPGYAVSQLGDLISRELEGQ